MMAVSAFLHLRCLIISPHNLGDDLVEALAGLQVINQYKDQYKDKDKKDKYKDKSPPTTLVTT